jgi:hypothetical protein
MTIIAILLVVLGCIAAGALAVSLTPFTFTAELNVSSAGHRKGAVRMCWLHPWIARWQYDVEGKRSELTLFGVTRVLNGGNDAGRKTEGSRISGIDKPVHAPASQAQARETDTTPLQKPRQKPEVFEKVFENHRETNMRRVPVQEGRAF